MERRKTRDIESVSKNRIETLNKIKSMLGHQVASEDDPKKRLLEISQEISKIETEHLDT